MSDLADAIGLLEALLAPRGMTREGVIESGIVVSRAIGSPGFKQDADWLRWRTGVADLLVVEGLGHDLPEQLSSQLADTIAATVRRAENL